MPTRSEPSVATASDPRALKRRLVQLAAGAASGLLLYLAFPPADIGALAFVALVPLIFAMRDARPGDAATVGVGLGVAFFAPLLSWIYLFGAAAFVAIVVLQTLWMVVTLVCVPLASPAVPPKWKVVVLPVALVVGEFLRGAFPFGGFTWGDIGYSQHDNLMMLRLASVTGVWGLSLAVIFVNVMFAEALVRMRRAPRISLAWVAAAATMVVMPAAIPVRDADGEEARIAMIQGNVPERTFDPRSDDDLVAASHMRLTRSLSEPPDLVVWAESAFDTNPLTDERFREPFLATIREARAPLLAGAIVELDDQGETKFGNVSMLFEEDGTLVRTYFKQHPVPFGEVVPFRSVLTPLISELERVPFDMLPGSTSTVFSIPQGNFASVICFESTFPGSVRSFITNGARLLVVSTNNSSFERSAASEQHVAFSQVRAAEHRMWVAHTALSGISAVVSPEGEVVARTELFKPAVLEPTVRFAQHRTVYGRFGDWLPLSLLAALAGMLASSFAAGRRQPEDAPVPPEEPAGERTLIVVPTYNEADNVAVLHAAVLAAAPQADVLFVDDSSPDGTGEVIAGIAQMQPRVHLITQATKMGLGRAYVAGFRWGLERGYTRFIEMDADLSHDPGRLPALLEACNEADLVIGSRYVEGGGVVGWGRGRHLLSWGGNVYARTLLGFGVKDSTSGFRCYRREVIEAIGLDSVRSDGYAFQIDMAYRAYRLGFRVKEVPIIFKERERGASKMSRAIVREAVVSVLRWGIRRLLR